MKYQVNDCSNELIKYEKASKSLKKNINNPIITKIFPKKTIIGKGFNFQPNKQSALELRGKFFTTSSIIYFGDTQLETTFGSENCVTGLIPDRLLNKVSNVNVCVVNNNELRSNNILFVIHDKGLINTILNIKTNIFYEISYKLKYFHIRNIIKNMKLNQQEIKEKKSILKSTPHFIIIDPTNKCNCRCTICYRSYKKLDDSDLSMENFKKLKSFLKNANIVNLMGTGESFLNKNFLTIARACKKNGATTFLASNGMLVTKNLKILKYIDDLNISFDGGTKETFEKIRIGAKFEKVIDNIKIIQSLKHKPIVRLDVRVSRQNLDELPEIVKVAKMLNIKEISFMPVCPQGMWLDDILLSDKDSLQFNKIKKEVLNLGEILKVKCLFGFYLGENSEVGRICDKKEINESMTNKKQPDYRVYCTAPFRMIYVEYTGKIRPCCILNKYMGDINENSIEEIWNNMEYQSLRASMVGVGELDDFCKNCRDSQRFL